MTAIPDRPGLVVYAPPGTPWWSLTSPTATAAYRCLCGATGSTAGKRGSLAVCKVLADWDRHIPCSPHRMAVDELRRRRG